MNAVYDIYKLDENGLRDELITRYTALDAQLNRSKTSQITLAGTCLGKVPLALADRIALVRNGTQIFSGIVTTQNINCGDCANNVKNWEAGIEGDSIVLGWRYVLASASGADPSGIQVGEDVYDKRPNNNDETSTRSALDRMLYYIRKHAGPAAHESRRLVTVSQADDDTRGTQGRSAYHIKKLTEVIKEVGEPDELFPAVNTNSSGDRVLTVPEIRDRTAEVVVAPEFGNVQGWEVSREYPKFNACWVISGVCTEDNGDGTQTETRVWVYAEDEKSVEKYGRIETVVTKSDIHIVREDPDKEDVVPVTEAEVRKMLEAEASAQLKDAAAAGHGGALEDKLKADLLLQAAVEGVVPEAPARYQPTSAQLRERIQQELASELKVPNNSAFDTEKEITMKKVAGMMYLTKLERKAQAEGSPVPTLTHKEMQKNVDTLMKSKAFRNMFEGPNAARNVAAQVRDGRMTSVFENLDRNKALLDQQRQKQLQQNQLQHNQNQLQQNAQNQPQQPIEQQQPRRRSNSMYVPRHAEGHGLG